ncbi:unnamed protein product [Sphacelaria rigidula]
MLSSSALHLLDSGHFTRVLSRLRTHDSRLLPCQSHIGATDLDFLEHLISPADQHPDTKKVRAMMPTKFSQLRSLLGGLSCYRKFLPNLSKRIRPIPDLLIKGAAFASTKDMEAIVRDLLKTLTEIPHLSVQDGSRLFQLHTDASTNGFGAVLNQPRLDGSV